VLSSDHALALPGTVRPLEEAKLYARVTGYVRVWHADLGDKVTAGQVLAELDTPDLAAQLSQARAQLAAAQAAVKQATAQRDYSKSNSSRYVGLADQKLVSRQQVEEQQAKAATDEATVSASISTVAAMEANVRRLAELQSFAKIVAPFAGTVATRSIERGALVRDGATIPLYTIVATDPVRIFIDVPQSIAPGIKVDMPAKITAREFGAREFIGKVTRSARALDAELHTMTTEIQVPNADGTLMPGMYVQAALALSTPHRVLEVPATALYTDAKGVRLAIVEGNKIRFAKIVVERDTGATVHIGAGLTGDEQVVKIAVPTLEEGTVVETAK
jgi:membrane fusion protein, multidrug efflux system